MKVKATIGPWTGVTAWDISTGDPIVPGPEQVTLPRLLGDDIRLAGYRAETTIAEKSVTILQPVSEARGGATTTTSSSYSAPTTSMPVCFGTPPKRWPRIDAFPWAR